MALCGGREQQLRGPKPGRDPWRRLGLCSHVFKSSQRAQRRPRSGRGCAAWGAALGSPEPALWSRSPFPLHSCLHLISQPRKTDEETATCFLSGRARYPAHAPPPPPDGGPCYCPNPDHPLCLGKCTRGLGDRPQNAFLFKRRTV